MADGIPARVQNGANGPSGYFDGSRTIVGFAGSGWGEILRDKFGVPNVVLTTQEHQIMQAQLQGRDLGMADLIASRVATNLAGNQAFLQAVADAVNGSA